MYDGGDANGLLLDKLCGVKGPRAYAALSDTLFVQFRASTISSGIGFIAYFKIQRSGMCFPL